MDAYDGGGAGAAPTGSLDGGSPGATGPEATGGTAQMVTVKVPDDTAHITLWRRDGSRRREVRGVIGAAFSFDGFGALDREAGRGVASAYELECHTVFHGSVTLPIGSVIMPAPAERYETVIQQPLNPRLRAVVTETAANVESITRQAPLDLVPVEGKSFPRLVGFGPRQGLSGVQFSFEVPDRATAAAVWATLGDEEHPQLAAWLVRSMHPLLPPVFFCEVRDLQEVDFDLAYGGTRSRFVAVVSEIAAPAPALTTPAVRYSDLVAAFGPSYDEIGTALPRYSQWGTAWEFASAS
ncbi:hypothetical protein [Microbacterium enclense]|nr:hypothetical protein [Microbacterium enclense]